MREPFEGSEWGERDAAGHRRTRRPAPAVRLVSTEPDPGRRFRLRAPSLTAALICAGALLVLAGLLTAAGGFSFAFSARQLDSPGAAIGKPFEAIEAAQRKQVRAAMAAPFVLGVPRKKLESIAECESHGNPRSIGGGGLYRGKYQFDKGTWRSVGGEGDPAKASELEQDRRAATLLKRSGTSPWPVCG